jgi:asparagine synthase (glutamine-hydrolysing)
MCGLVGFWQLKSGDTRDTLSAYIDKMSQTIAHRGPDSKGIWVDESMGLALGHCRLSILDLSSAGDQPMTSCCERFVVIYN